MRECLEQAGIQADDLVLVACSGGADSLALAAAAAFEGPRFSGRAGESNGVRVGAVVIDDDFNLRISGYNGFPRGVDDNIEERHERPTKYLWTSHAEENCIAQAARTGISLKGCTLLVTSLFPCTTCSRLIIQAGIKRILAPRLAENTRWDEQAKIAYEMLMEAGVEILYYGEEE